jgi:hypothetical protein
MVLLAPYIKINSKWIIDINARVKSMKHLEERDFHNLWLGKEFLNMIPKA